MRTPDEAAAVMFPGWPWPRVAGFRPTAAKLRRDGFGPSSARYMALYLMLQDVHTGLVATTELVPECYADGVIESHTIGMFPPVIAAVGECLLRHLEIEARHRVAGRRLVKPYTPMDYGDTERPSSINRPAEQPTPTLTPTADMLFRIVNGVPVAVLPGEPQVGVFTIEDTVAATDVPLKSLVALYRIAVGEPVDTEGGDHAGHD